MSAVGEICCCCTSRFVNGLTLDRETVGAVYNQLLICHKAHARLLPINWAESKLAIGHSLAKKICGSPSVSRCSSFPCSRGFSKSDASPSKYGVIRYHVLSLVEANFSHPLQ